MLQYCLEDLLEREARDMLHTAHSNNREVQTAQLLLITIILFAAAKRLWLIILEFLVVSKSSSRSPGIQTRTGLMSVIVTSGQLQTDPAASVVFGLRRLPVLNIMI